MKYFLIVLMLLIPQGTSDKKPAKPTDMQLSTTATSTINALQIDSPKIMAEIGVLRDGKKTGIILYRDGTEIARCEKIEPAGKPNEMVVSLESKLSDCYLENGANFDAVMNAWLQIILVTEKQR